MSNYARPESYQSMKNQRDSALEEARAMRERLSDALDEIVRLRAQLDGRASKNLKTEIEREKTKARRPPQNLNYRRSR
jgi:hypothetical protein